MKSEANDANINTGDVLDRTPSFYSSRSMYVDDGDDSTITSDTESASTKINLFQTARSLLSFTEEENENSGLGDNADADIIFNINTNDDDDDNDNDRGKDISAFTITRKPFSWIEEQMNESMNNYWLRLEYDDRLYHQFKNEKY